MEIKKFVFAVLHVLSGVGVMAVGFLLGTTVGRFSTATRQTIQSLTELVIIGLAIAEGLLLFLGARAAGRKG